MCQGGTALVSPWVAGKFRGYREIHWVWMFLSLIPSLDDDGNQSVVNIYIYAFTLFQVSCLRIRPFNTSQSDQMIERNKATFPRMEEFIYLFIYYFCPVVSWWWCCFSACSQCEHPGAFHVTFVNHRHKVAIWIQSGSRVVSAKVSGGRENCQTQVNSLTWLSCDLRQHAKGQLYGLGDIRIAV